MRKGFAEKLAKIEVDASVRLPRLRAEFEAAQAKAIASEQAWRQDLDHAASLQAQLSGESCVFTHEVAELENQLATRVP